MGLKLQYNIQFNRSKFGERFYRVIIMDFKEHTKAILVEAAVLLGNKSPLMTLNILNTL